MTATMCLAQDTAADALLDRDPLALLVGMVLDQQIPLEHAFSSPHVLVQRLGHDLDAHELATFDPDELAAVFARPRALHRFPGRWQAGSSRSAGRSWSATTVTSPGCGVTPPTGASCWPG